LFSFFFSEIYYHKFGLIIIPTINYILYIFWVLQPKFQLPWCDRVVGGSGRGDIMPLSMLNLLLQHMCEKNTVLFHPCAELTESAIAVHSLASELSYLHRRLGPMVSGTQVDEVKNC